jgi:hypothetical protein
VGGSFQPRTKLLPKVRGFLCFIIAHVLQVLYIAVKMLELIISIFSLHGLNHMTELGNMRLFLAQYRGCEQKVPEIWLRIQIQSHLLSVAEPEPALEPQGAETLAGAGICKFRLRLLALALGRSKVVYFIIIHLEQEQASDRNRYSFQKIMKT